MPDRHGPLRPNRFAVELDGITIAGFQRVEIPSKRTEQIEYREGNDPAHHRRLWGRSTYEDLILERGANKENADLYKWRTRVDEGNVDAARKTVAVVLQDEAGQSHIRWNFTNAWPKEYQPPTLESNTGAGQGNVATETYVVTFDEMERKEV